MPGLSRLEMPTEPWEKVVFMLLCWVRDDSDSVWLELYYRFLVLERHINPGDLVPVLVILLHVRI